MRNALTGTRVRERRLEVGLRQADLARMAAISPAYLNLIEHNRRRVGPALLSALAAGLGVEEAALAEGAESALFEGLREAAAGAPDAGAGAPETGRVEEFVSRFPGWAGLLAARQARIGALERTVEALSERMAHDPFLSASLHEVVSAVTSVRSTAAILAETEEIDPEWRARFHHNIHEDSLRLSEAAAALVAYLDTSQESETGLSSPQEEVEAWLARAGWHLAALERAQMPAAESLIVGAPDSGQRCGAQAGAGLAGAGAGRCAGAAAGPFRGGAGRMRARPRRDRAASWRAAWRRHAAACRIAGGAAGRGRGAGSRAGGLRCLRHADLSPPGAGFRVAAAWGGLSALAALRGAGAADGAGARGRRDGRPGAAAVPDLCLQRAAPSGRL